MLVGRGGGRGYQQRLPYFPEEPKIYLPAPSLLTSAFAGAFFFFLSGAINQDV